MRNYIFSCVIFIYFRTYWLVRDGSIFLDEYHSRTRDCNVGNIFCVLMCIQKCLVFWSFSCHMLDAFHLADPTREFCTVAMFSFAMDWNTAYRIFTFCMTSSRTQLHCLPNYIRKLKYKTFTVAQSCCFIFYKNLLCASALKVLEISVRWCRPILKSDVRTASRFALLKTGHYNCKGQSCYIETIQISFLDNAAIGAEVK